jgi:hypothetical protein
MYCRERAMSQMLPSSVLSKPRSDRASAGFFYLVETIASHVEPTKTQLAALQSSYESTAEFLAGRPEFSGLLEQIHAQGSRQIGTLVRPSDRSREGFDIDLVARLNRSAMERYGGNGGPRLLLGNFQRALADYARQHSLKIHPWQRCVTLEYASGMFADITPIIDDPILFGTYGETHGRVPDRELHLYDGTNPRGYSRYFDDVAAITPVFFAMESFAKAFDSVTRSEIVPLPRADEVFGRLLSRLVQLLKLHRNIAFGAKGVDSDFSPKSVFITTLAAAAYADKAAIPHSTPLELLLDIVEGMPNYFEVYRNPDGTEAWHLTNPSAPGDNLASGMNTPGNQAAFKWWHARLLDDLAELLELIETSRGVDVLLSKIEKIFGDRAASAVRLDETSRRQTLRSQNSAQIYSAAAAPIIVTSKTHTFHGD